MIDLEAHARTLEERRAELLKERETATEFGKALVDARLDELQRYVELLAKSRGVLEEVVQILATSPRR